IVRDRWVIQIQPAPLAVSITTFESSYNPSENPGLINRIIKAKKPNGLSFSGFKAGKISLNNPSC
ncbi:MAG TPA: hypothetical protein DD990_17700, partial [Cyanobacteria bacterium UBA11368]|nr:hypothetical protein [Cyanobacteria bacterium UBA11368]